MALTGTQGRRVLRRGSEEASQMERIQMTQTTTKSDDFTAEGLGIIAVLCVLIVGLYLIIKVVLS